MKFALKYPRLLLHKRAIAFDRAMLSLLVVAFIIRVTAVIAFPSLAHPDENFQLFEQGHRFAFGYGVVSWEWSAGIRSPVLPFLLSCIFRVAEPLVGGPEGYLVVAKLVLVLSSLSAVAAVYRMGQRTGPTHALIAGLVAATWFELIYFAGRPLTEAVATTVLLVGLSLASLSENHLTQRRLLAIGLCFGLCLMLRVQLVAGLLVAALWIGRFHLRARWLPMILGSLLPIGVFGIADFIAWGTLFHSYIESVRINLIQGKASAFGIRPAGWYLERLVLDWAFALPILLTLIVVRSRKSMLWIAVSLAIIASHSLIPHKEYRFVFPAFACLIVVAAMGSADLLERARDAFGVRRAAAGYLVIAVAAFWVQTSALLAFAPGFVSEWFRDGSLIEASFIIAKKPELCGVLFYDHEWWRTGGYAHLHRNVPLYDRKSGAIAVDSPSAFDAIVLKRSSIPHFIAEFRVLRCVGSDRSPWPWQAAITSPDDVCVMVRDGSCTVVSKLRPMGRED